MASGRPSSEAELLHPCSQPGTGAAALFLLWQPFLLTVAVASLGGRGLVRPRALEGTFQYCDYEPYSGEARGTLRNRMAALRARTPTDRCRLKEIS